MSHVLRKLFIAMLALTTFIFIDACSRRDRDHAKDKIRKKAREIKAEVQNTDLKGSWDASRCKQINYLGNQINSSQVSLEFSGEEIRETEEFFSDENCDRPLGKIRYTGRYEMRDRVAKDSYALDVKFNEVKVVANNESGRGILNFINFCGESNWQVDNEMDMTSRSKEPLCLLKDLPTEEYTVVRFIDDKKIKLAKESDEEDERPEVREANLVFQKQDE